MPARSCRETTNKKPRKFARVRSEDNINFRRNNLIMDHHVLLALATTAMLSVYAQIPTIIAEESASLLAQVRDGGWREH